METRILDKQCAWRQRFLTCLFALRESERAKEARQQQAVNSQIPSKLKVTVGSRERYTNRASSSSYLFGHAGERDIEVKVEAEDVKKVRKMLVNTFKFEFSERSTTNLTVRVGTPIRCMIILGTATSIPNSSTTSTKRACNSGLQCSRRRTRVEADADGEWSADFESLRITPTGRMASGCRPPPPLASGRTGSPRESKRART